jgi:hypothetical protein
MDVDELAGVATAALVQRFGSGPADPLVAVVSRRLQFSYVGKRVLAGLRVNPTDAWHRELTTSVIADELTRAPAFELALTEALTGATGAERPSGGLRRGPIRVGWLVVAAVVLALLVLAVAVLALNRTRGGSDPVSGTRTGLRGISLDLDRPGDQVGDIVFGTSGATATRQATLGPRLVGTQLAPAACAKAVAAYGRPTIAAVKVGDVICVRTSGGGIAAVTLSTADRIDWLYWPAGAAGTATA